MIPLLRKRKRKFWQNDKFHTTVDFVIEIVKIVVISLAIIIPVRYFLIQPFYVKGASMEPNFYNHEYLIINEISYRFNDPLRGDIVVFKYPTDPGQYFIKRIIGLPNEKIKIRDGKVKISNQENEKGIFLDESVYLDKDTYTFGNIDVQLGLDEYYLLGDNRPSSLDSRSFGPIERRDIIGKTWLRGWPLDKITVFITPEYNL